MKVGPHEKLNSACPPGQRNHPATLGRVVPRTQPRAFGYGRRFHRFIPAPWLASLVRYALKLLHAEIFTSADRTKLVLLILNTL